MCFFSYFLWRLRHLDTTRPVYTLTSTWEKLPKARPSVIKHSLLNHICCESVWGWVARRLGFHFIFISANIQLFFERPETSSCPREGEGVATFFFPNTVKMRWWKPTVCVSAGLISFCREITFKTGYHRKQTEKYLLRKTALCSCLACHRAGHPDKPQWGRQNLKEKQAPVTQDNDTASCQDTEGLNRATERRQRSQSEK